MKEALRTHCPNWYCEGQPVCLTVLLKPYLAVRTLIHWSVKLCDNEIHNRFFCNVRDAVTRVSTAYIGPEEMLE